MYSQQAGGCKVILLIGPCHHRFNMGWYPHSRSCSNSRCDDCNNYQTHEYSSPLTIRPLLAIVFFHHCDIFSMWVGVQQLFSVQRHWNQVPTASSIRQSVSVTICILWVQSQARGWEMDRSSLQADSSSKKCGWLYVEHTVSRHSQRLFWLKNARSTPYCTLDSSAQVPLYYSSYLHCTVACRRVWWTTLYDSSASIKHLPVSCARTITPVQEY